MTRPLMVSAPGSLMVLGEHAVLRGYPCLVAAVHHRVRVSLLPRNDGLVSLSSALGQYEADRDDLPDHPSFRFALAALRLHPTVLPGGLDAMIEADMPATIGFGTSAAVTVAMIGALHQAARGTWSVLSVFAESRAVIQAVQGRGSGADAAASCLGGVVRYAMNEGEPVMIDNTPHPITALYCGYKKPTAEVIAHVQHQWSGREDALRSVFERMAAEVAEAEVALVRDDADEMGTHLNQGQRLMEELGVSTPELNQCVAWLRQDEQITGAKISGSGLGDCAIGWGRAEERPTSFARVDTTVALEGIRCE